MRAVEPRPRRQTDRRSALLAALRAAPGPLSVAEAAAAVGIAESTAQFHLAMLVTTGRVERTPLRTGSAGRPLWLYAAARPRRAAPEPYEELVRVLASQMGEGSAAAAVAREAGRRWADAAPAGVPASATSPAGAVASLAAVLDDMGFAPETGSGGDEIVLHACPFEAVARDHRAIVCGVHLGLVEQAAAAIGGGISVDGLEPFRSERPLACAVRLHVPAPPAPANEGAL